MSYGERYLKVNRFIDYCEKVNIKIDKEELEYYESRGIMLPTARVIMPDEYIQDAYGGLLSDELVAEKWGEIKGLFDRSLIVDADYATLTDDELIDSFDRAFGQRENLLRPEVGDYKPWQSYEVRVDNPLHQRVSRANHYYSYWQIHQLYRIRQYPNLYQNRRLVQYLPPEQRERAERGWPYYEEFFRSFNGIARFYDALSFFITMHYRDQKRTFATISARHQIRRLSDVQHQALLTRLAQHAQAVMARYGLSETDLLRFLSDLINLHREYEKAERAKLDQELKQDIFYQANFVMYVTGKDWEAVGEALTFNTPLPNKATFLSLNDWYKTKYRAGSTLKWAVKAHARDLGSFGVPVPTYTFSDKDAEEIIRFCEDADLTLLLETLEGLTAVGIEERELKFTRSRKYQSVKNLTTGFEYLMKVIDEKGPQLLTGTPTFFLIVRTMMQNESSWIGLLDANRNLTRGGTVPVFETNLSTLQTAFLVSGSEPHFIARCFLIACLARNVSVHFFPTDDWFYGELFTEMAQATVYAIVYTWRVAKKEGWV